MRFKSLVGFVIMIVMVALSGCMFWPVNKEDVIGSYQSVLEDGTPSLPDGGSESLELKPDGTCKQEIALKDGKTFSAKGTWEWRTYKWRDDTSYKKLEIKGIYSAVDNMTEKIRPNIEATIETVSQSYPVGRTLSGRVALGSDEGTHYEKK